MKKLNRYIINSFIGPFVMTFFICLFVLLMQFLWKFLDDMVGKGIEWSVIGKLLFYAAVSLTPMAFPLATLLASIMTFGNLGENYELVAMKASGISLLRIMKPLIIVAICITAFAFYCSNTILPQTNLKFNSIRLSLQRQKPELAVEPGVFSNDIDGYSIKVGDKNQDTGMLYDLLIYDHSSKHGNVSITLADSGTLAVSNDRNSMIMTLYSGETGDEVDYLKNKRTKLYKYRRSKFGKQVIYIPVSGFAFKESNEEGLRNNYRMQNIDQLKYFEDSLTIVYNNRVRRFASNMRFNSKLNKTVAILSTDNDSLKAADYESFTYDTVANLNTALAQLTAGDRARITRDALSDARRNKQRINQNNIELDSFKKRLIRYPMEVHRKFTWSVACLIFFFIGAPLGAIIRKGGLGLPTVISILLFIAYYMVSISTEKFAREDVWSVANGMWFATAVFLPFGIFLTYKAATDSDLLNVETTIEKIKKLFKKNKNTQKEK